MSIRCLLVSLEEICDVLCGEARGSKGRLFVFGGTTLSALLKWSRCVMLFGCQGCSGNRWVVHTDRSGTKKNSGQAQLRRCTRWERHSFQRPPCAPPHHFKATDCRVERRPLILTAAAPVVACFPA